MKPTSRRDAYVSALSDCADMGGNFAGQALSKGYEVVGYNRTPSVTDSMLAAGLMPARNFEHLAALLPRPRIALIYVTHGEATEAVCRDLRPYLEVGDIVIDGGNSYWADSERRYRMFAEDGIHFLDVGTSGGINGATRGACFMVGGDQEAYEVVAPLLKDLAVDDAVLYVGPSGGGHFAKLVHNAIEFGMVQAIAEGVELLARSGRPLDLQALFNNWNHGSVIRSWLVELMAKALGETRDMSRLATYVEDTGEVKWVVNWATENDISVPVVSLAQTMLMEYRDRDSATAKAVALLRNQFGGHPICTNSDHG